MPLNEGAEYAANDRVKQRTHAAADPEIDVNARFLQLEGKGIDQRMQHGHPGDDHRKDHPQRR